MCSGAGRRGQSDQAGGRQTGAALGGGTRHRWLNRFRRILVRWDKKPETTCPACISLVPRSPFAQPGSSDRLVGIGSASGMLRGKVALHRSDEVVEVERLGQQLRAELAIVGKPIPQE